jgi:putative transposase
MSNKLSASPAGHQRRSIRLKGYDYSLASAYFITICTQDREPVFGKIDKGEVKLNEFGQIAHEQWRQIPNRFDNVELEPFVVMPNHVHGIIVINEKEPVGAGFTSALGDETPNMGAGARFTAALDDETINTGVGARFAPALDDETVNTGVGASPTPTNGQTGQPQGLPLRVTVGSVVGTYKSLVANECLKLYKTKNEFMGKLWQRNYWEHIIRDEQDLNNAHEYILNNPAQWETDQLYPRG